MTAAAEEEKSKMTTKKSDDRQYDLRVVERRLTKGQLDQKEYEAFLKNLPDEAAGAEYLDVFEEPPAEELTPCVEEPTFTSA